MKLIFCDHWAPAPEGWVILKESDQDITKPFPWSNDSVDSAFSCHGLEHVDLMGGISYFKEAFRVLKPGGIIRTVCPCTDKLTVYHPNLSKDYAKTSLLPYFTKEEESLNELGISLVQHSEPFLWHSLIKFHHHKFVWSSSLIVHVLERIGFSEVNVCEPTQTFFEENICFERKIRGLSEDFIKTNEVEYFDCESLAIEARK